MHGRGRLKIGKSGTTLHLMGFRWMQIGGGCLELKSDSGDVSGFVGEAAGVATHTPWVARVIVRSVRKSCVFSLRELAEGWVEKELLAALDEDGAA